MRSLRRFPYIKLCTKYPSVRNLKGVSYKHKSILPLQTRHTTAVFHLDTETLQWIINIYWNLKVVKIFRGRWFRNTFYLCFSCRFGCQAVILEKEYWCQIDFTLKVDSWSDTKIREIINIKFVTFHEYILYTSIRTCYFSPSAR